MATCSVARAATADAARFLGAPRGGARRDRAATCELSTASVRQDLDLVERRDAVAHADAAEDADEVEGPDRLGCVDQLEVPLQRIGGQPRRATPKLGGLIRPDARDPIVAVA